MAIGTDQGSAGSSSCRMAAGRRGRAGIAVGAPRAGRRPARRGVLAAAVGCAVLLAGLAAAAPAAGSVSRGSAAAAVRGARLWVSRVNGAARGQTAAVAASPDGSTVFVAGTVDAGAGSSDDATVAYAAATGARLWASRYAGTGGFNAATAVAVSPDGNTVFVTGGATVAYDAATGAQLWASPFTGPLQFNVALSIAVSPAGGTVFVTGYTHGEDANGDLIYRYETAAYNAADGAQLWAATYQGGSVARSVAVGPGGHAVYVTGVGVVGRPSHGDAVTVAYDAADGAQLWVQALNHPGRRTAAASAVAVSPGGHTVYVAGVTGGATRADYFTVAYKAATGTPRWTRRYAGPAGGAAATAVAAGPGGRTVYVTGISTGVTSGRDYATIAYNAADGARRWASRYNGPANRGDFAYAVAVSPGGRTVYVTGASFAGASSGNDFATVAYNAATGARRWARRYNGPGNGGDQATSVAVSPAGGTVFVAGPSLGGTGQGLGYATIAYKG
jgi:hypothetical protein